MSLQSRYYLQGRLYSPRGYEQISGPSAATGLTIPSERATVARIQAVSQNIRWRDDGTSPTASVGMQLAAGNELWYDGDLTAFELIEESAGAEVNISYYDSTISDQAR